MANDFTDAQWGGWADADIDDILKEIDQNYDKPPTNVDQNDNINDMLLNYNLFDAKTDPKTNEYKFLQNNSFLNCDKVSIELSKDLKHYQFGLKYNLSYHQSTQHLISGYITNNYNSKYIPFSIQNTIIKFLNSPFLYYIGYDLMSIKFDLKNAILSFEAYIQLNLHNKNDNNLINAYKYLGKSHADNEEEQKAINAYLIANKLDPQNLDVLILLGLSYANEMNSAKSTFYLKEFIKYHPDYSFLLKKFKQQVNMDTIDDVFSSFFQEDVIKLFKQALNINEMDNDLHIVLGILYFLSSDFNNSEKHFKKSTELKPNDAASWNKLGAVRANNGKNKQAIDAYLKAIALRPNYTRTLSNVAISYANQDKHQEAAKYFLKCLTINPSSAIVWSHFKMSLVRLNKMDLIVYVDNKDVNAFKTHFDF